MSEQEKDLRHVKRDELVEIIYAYQQNEQALRAEIAALEQARDERSVKIKDAGSLAEAALALSGVFDAAQEAAECYLSEIRDMHENAEADALAIVAQARTQADEMRAAAADECAAMKQAAEAECALMRKEILQFMEAQEALRALLKETR